MTGLEPSIDEQELILKKVSEFVVSHAATVRTLPVAPSVTAEDLRSRLEQIHLDTPWTPDEAIRWCIDLLTEATVHTTSPMYFGLFNPTPTFMGIIGDLLTAAFNPQLAAWSHAPGAAEIEAWLIRYFGERIGFDGDPAGSFTSGGAEANATALHLALTRAFTGFGEGGLRAVDADPVVCVSAESHHAWLKIAHVCGIGRNAIRFIPVDEDLKMSVPALRETLAGDRRAGHRPVLVVATAGTTSAGVIDPLTEVAGAAQDYGAFFHVDAAWAGAAVLSDQLRTHLNGIEEADSVTVDAHKWLSVPMGAGMFITRHRDLLLETYRVSTAYMPGPVDATTDPYTSSNQWSRRFIGLKLFLTLLTAGRSGYSQQLEHDTGLADRLREGLAADGWQILNRTPFPVVCFADPSRPGDAGFHQRIVDGVVASGQAWISTTNLAGRPAIRACITSHRTTADDIDALVQHLDSARP
ncbi:MAG TPA: aminotransferase class V-fold PLP-dependent enzyme [Acidimicrobiia bacterium]|nr:aminotransferase class V-fold PLP-dependent enzyme [Acidimicrobiia bacterium]